MNKRILILVLVFSFVNTFVSQNKTKQKEKSKETNSGGGATSFKKGQVDLNLGFGFGRNRYYYGSIYTRATPPISTSLDFAATDNISVGAYFAFTRTRWNSSGNYWNNGVPYQYNDTYTWYYYTFGARAAYHLGEYIDIKELDIYLGLMLGQNFVKFKYTTDNNSGGRTYTNNVGTRGLYVAFFAGARYMFTEKVGLFGEFGYGLTYGNIGLNLKLK